jgi:flagellar hook-basal body complex protein FliE
MNGINTNFGGLGPISNFNFPSVGSTSNQSEGGGFGDVLKNAISSVNELNGGADQQVGNLLKGANTDMSGVMVAVEKADVAFQLMMQVRNKIVSAYQDIEKMQF